MLFDPVHETVLANGLKILAVDRSITHPAFSSIARTLVSHGRHSSSAAAKVHGGLITNIALPLIPWPFVAGPRTLRPA